VVLFALLQVFCRLALRGAAAVGLQVGVGVAKMMLVGGGIWAVAELGMVVQGGRLEMGVVN